MSNIEQYIGVGSLIWFTIWEARGGGPRIWKAVEQWF